MGSKFLEKIRKELHISNCGFSYGKPDKFVRSQVNIYMQDKYRERSPISISIFFRSPCSGNYNQKMFFTSSGG